MTMDILKDENKNKTFFKKKTTSMFNNVKTLNGYKLHSLDDEIGKVKEFFFNDKHWTIRYLVADRRSASDLAWDKLVFRKYDYKNYGGN